MLARDESAFNDATPRGGRSLLGFGDALMTDAEDYLQFGQILLNGGQLNGKRLLSPKIVELMGAVFLIYSGRYDRP